ncbi:LIM and calponin homology domains-containing protein 1 isoform X12 [Amblyraja radiata]|uniref:LIM and calponin homology domains-containing protein 1 isoform X12 n=1 Tax=Amblyraja radiata TaxID=386614 RepID=UPI0014022FA7|nr:LIM and calponin homology domains-containing protein 1 isoform X12 [Amblyraja radiata]
MASPNVRDGEWGETPHQDSGSGPGPAFIEAQHWIEQVTGRGFGDKDFRTGLENGILLCELLNAIKPGAVKKINRLPTPIAGLDNITLFLRACEELGLKGSQLFDPGDLQDMTNRASVKVPECSRKMKNVLITIYWLGKAANSCTSYSGPTLNLKEFEGLLAQIQKEMEDTESPKRSVRDSGYIDSWDSERSDSLSPPRHARDDSFDSLESFGSRSQQTPSPDVIFRGSSDGRGSDSESDVASKIPDVKRDDMSARRSSYNDPKSSLPFNQYLPNKHNHTAYMPAPLRKKRAERGENYRKSWSNATSPVGAERPFSHSHPEPIQEEHSEESSQGEDFADPSSTFPNTQEINDSKPTVKSNLVAAEDVGGLKNPLEVHLVEDPGHKASKECTRREGKEEDEIKKLKRIQKAGITVLPAAERYRRLKQQQESSGHTSPDIILRRENTFSTNYLDSDSETEEGEWKLPDLEKDDFALRKAQLHQCKPKVVNQFLAGPCTKKDRELWASIKHSPRGIDGASQRQEQKMESKSPIKAAESEVIILQEAGMEAGVLLKSQKKNGHNEEEQVKGPDVERDDLARRKALVGFTSRQEPHTFIPSSITSADMEIWQRLKLSTNTSEEASKPTTTCSEVKPKCGSEIGKAAEVDLAHRRARNTKSASPSCQRSVHFGPVTEIGQQRGDKMSISRAGPGSESEEEPDSCTVKAYTCHQLPSVSSAVILNSQDNAMGDKSQIRAHSEVILASQKAISCEPEETFLSDTCTAEYFPRIPSPVLVAHTVTINKNAQDSSEGSEDDEEGIPDVEKDDMMSRRIRDTAKQSSASFNKFLPVPSSQQDQELSGINKEAEREPKKRRKSEDESQRTYSPTAALSDDTGSVSMNDMRTEDDGPTQPHSKARHEELHKVHSRLREDQDKWQDDLARWKSRRRSASQDLIKRKEERDIVEKIMSGERSLSERRKSIKTYKEIVEEKESREKELQEAYKKARTPEEAEEILKKYSQRFMISEAFLENLEMPKFLERSQSVDSDSSCSPTREPNSLKYLRQQSLPIQKYTATVEAVIIPSSQPQANFTAMVTSPTKTVASKAVPMLTPKPYSQPKDSQTVLKSFKKNGKVRINGETSPTFTRVEENESTSPGLSPLLTRSQMFEGVARVDSPLQLQEDNSNRVSRLEQLASSAINNPQTENTDKEEQAEMTIVITTTQQANTKDDSELKSFCNEQKEESVINADDPQRDLDISIVHIALSDNAELDIRDAVESKIMTSAEACLLPKSEASNNSPQEQFKQEGLKSTTHQQDKTGDVLDSDQVISELKEEVTENSRYDDAINQQAEVDSSENINEKYRKEHEKLRQEWEKAQKEVEEEERRYHEEERKIIEETVTPLTPRSVPVQLPSEWLSISKAEEVRNSESTELTHGESKQTELQKQTMVEIDSCQKGDEGGLLVQETQSQKDTKQRSTQTQAEALRSNDENGSEENQEVAERNSLEKWHWQDTKQLESETLKLNLQSAPHFSQRDEETDSERQIQARSQTLITDHHQVSAQAADSPVFPDRYQNAQEPPLFLDVHRNQLSNVPDEQKTGSLDRSWAHQSNMMDRKKWSGSHENLQSSQSLLQPPSSPTPLQSPGRSVSGKKLCSTCGLPLGKGAAMIIETLSLYFHIQCFTCGICRGQLGDATTGTDVRIRNGLLNCNDCYIRSRTAGQPTTL